MLEYQQGISYSNEVAKKLEKELQHLENECEISVQTFYNCREQGYVFKLMSYKGVFFRMMPVSWVFAHRNTDELYIILSDDSHEDTRNMYDEEAWSNEQKADSSSEAAKMIARYFIEMGEKEIDRRG